MKTTISNNNKGFIALFFTLSISSVLLAYVAASSSSVFDFMRAREDFRLTRDTFKHTMVCADGFIDMMIRSGLSFYSGLHSYSFVFEDSECTITNFSSVQVTADIINFSFISGSIYISGTMTNGFISKVYSSYISL